MESVSFDDASALLICVNSKALFYRKQFYINIYWNKKKSKKKKTIKGFTFPQILIYWHSMHLMTELSYTIVALQIHCSLFPMAGYLTTDAMCKYGLVMDISALYSFI